MTGFLVRALRCFRSLGILDKRAATLHPSSSTRRPITARAFLWLAVRVLPRELMMGPTICQASARMSNLLRKHTQRSLTRAQRCPEGVRHQLKFCPPRKPNQVAPSLVTNA